MDMDWDCIVVGGGAAGLSASLVLGRARRRTLLVEGGERVDGGFALDLAGGGRELTRRVILATGVDYRPPDLPGLAALWGRSVFHCPFCHGWEMRDGALAVLGGGPGGLHRVLLLRGWSEDLVLLSDGPAELEPGDLGRLSAAGVEVDERPVARLIARDGALAAVEFADGSTRAREGLLVPVTVAQRSPLAEQLGAEPADPGPVAVDALVVDAMGRTTAEGVSAAGDASAQMQQVALAISAGSGGPRRCRRARPHRRPPRMQAACRGSPHESHQLPRNVHITIRNPRHGPPGQRRLLVGRTDGGRVLTLVIEQTSDP